MRAKTMHWIVSAYVPQLTCNLQLTHAHIFKYCITCKSTYTLMPAVWCVYAWGAHFTKSYRTKVQRATLNLRRFAWLKGTSWIPMRFGCSKRMQRIKHANVKYIHIYICKSMCVCLTETFTNISCVCIYLYVCFIACFLVFSFILIY